MSDVGSVTDEWTHDDLRRYLDFASDRRQEWQGIPVPLKGHPLRLHDRHPMADFYRSLDGTEIRVIVGGPSLDDSGDEEEIVNEWFSRKLNVDVVVFKKGPEGRRFVVKVPRAPDRSMDRLDLWLMTLGASDAWDLGAEARAMEKLSGLLSDRQMRHYCLTGSFLESSPRSGLTYVFRRLRPTIALTGNWPWFRRSSSSDTMKCLAVLCLHSIGYYEKSWAGCLVPSDDVIAHLLFCRADEAGFWREANQHDPASPEAGL